MRDFPVGLGYLPCDNKIVVRQAIAVKTSGCRERVKPSWGYLNVVPKAANDKA